MFAFAIWERNSGRVVLARDRLGIKPLYYTERPGRLRFASTLPALLAAGDVDTGIDPAALHHYMSLHAVVPAPLTIFKGVRRRSGSASAVRSSGGASPTFRLACCCRAGSTARSSPLCSPHRARTIYGPSPSGSRPSARSRATSSTIPI